MIYIKPPRGDILLNELHECVMTRINYFLYKYRKEDVPVSKEALKFEYLSIGTALDRTGHFILRLLSVHSKSLKEFIATSEAKFIVERLEFLSPKEIVQLIKTSIRHLDELHEKNNLVWEKELKYILTEIKSAFGRYHLVDFNHDQKCKELNLKVPFQMCLSLVAKRELNMEKGNVTVPCGKWKTFLECLLEAFINKEINKIECSEYLSESMSDSRLQELKSIVYTAVFKRSAGNSNNSNINSDELDKLKVSFPPCMGNLYNNLKVNHRLSHYARFNLSLFLKDIGMPLNESIAFWQNEYSKPSKCGGKCSHSWQRDSAKYTYSIRHLYGLEGKRANYCTPSCSKIQANNLGPSEEGGCPFLNFDANKLYSFLDPKIIQNKTNMDAIIAFKSRNQIQEACIFYQSTLIKAANLETSCDGIHHKTPVEYFLKLNKHLNLDVR